MSVHVYLKGNEVQSIEGFTEEGFPGLPGIKLFRDGGRWYTILQEPTDPVPAAIVNIVDEISFIGWFPHYPYREAGVYRYESAEAEVELSKGVSIGKGGKSGEIEYRTEICIKAKKMDDLLELYRQIRTGSIRPEQSYEGEQGGMSRAELEAELKRIQQSANSILEGVKADLRTLHRDLKGGWPFCLKSKVAQEISSILDHV